MLGNFKKQNNNLKSGFTLVELLITISMFVIVTGVVLVNSNKFDSTVLLNNFAYDVALTIKQAQSYGVNVRESSTGQFGTAYGVYFNITDAPAGRTNFVLFNDVDKNKMYATGDITKCPANDPSNLECIQKFSMTKGTSVKSLCVGADEGSCNGGFNQLSILFIRPSQNAKIYTENNWSIENGYAQIVLAAANGATSTVVVTSVGQVYVKK